MIGYYVHHHGRGHLHRAQVLAERLLAEGEATTVLSSLPRPAGWTQDWVRLPLDVDESGRPQDPTAGGALHWAPLHHDGLRSRMATVSAWLEQARPRLVVCDVSQEVALLCRLHGVPVVSVVQPGRRSDPAHVTGLRAATALVAFWPASARGPLPSVPDDVAARVQPLGGLSRFAPEPARARRPGPPRVVVLGGRGGDAWSSEELIAVRAATPGFHVTVLGAGEAWVEEPWPVLRDADVAVTHAGQNAVAEVAAARLPAVVVPAARPFDEQTVTAAVLGRPPWPVARLDRLAHDDWTGLLLRTAALDGGSWATWCDGRAADRFTDVVRRVADGGLAPAEVVA